MTNDTLRKEFSYPAYESDQKADSNTAVATTAFREVKAETPTLRFSPEVQRNLDLMHG